MLLTLPLPKGGGGGGEITFEKHMLEIPNFLESNFNSIIYT